MFSLFLCCRVLPTLVFFFFQAEDGIRDIGVTGVQTCALPILAVLFALGGLVQINPIWLYGPFDPAQVSSPAQPDWYIGWVEGALRMYPPWEFRLFGRLVPNPFLPAVLVPAASFGLLYLWPFLEQR